MTDKGLYLIKAHSVSVRNSQRTKQKEKNIKGYLGGNVLNNLPLGLGFSSRSILDRFTKVSLFITKICLL